MFLVETGFQPSILASVYSEQIENGISIILNRSEYWKISSDEEANCEQIDVIYKWMLEIH